MTCTCGKPMSGRLRLPLRGLVCVGCFTAEMRKPPPKVLEAQDRTPAASDHHDAREHRIRLYQALYGMGRGIFDGAKRRERLPQGRAPNSELAYRLPPAVRVSGD